MGAQTRLPMQILSVEGELSGRDVAPLDRDPGRERRSWSRELIKAIADDIGADMTAYIEVMHPEAIAAASSTFKTSIRNHIYNQVMAAIEITDADEIDAWLKDRKKFRREWLSQYRKIRRKKIA